MSLTYAANLVANASKTAGTTLVNTVAAGAAVGSVLVVYSAWDNAAAANGASSQLSCADSVGNVYTKVQEWTAAGGAANGGVTTAVWICYVSIAIPTNGTITITSTSSRTARSCGVDRYTCTGGAVAAASVTNGVVSATVTPGTVSLTGLTSRDYCYLDCIGWELSGETATPPSGYTAGTLCQSSGSAAATNVGVTTHRKITTATTGDSPAAGALGTAADNVRYLIALYDFTPLNWTIDSADGAADTMALADAAPTFDDGLGVADTVAMVDSFSWLWDALIQPADAVALVDQLDLVQDIQLSFADTVGFGGTFPATFTYPNAILYPSGGDLFILAGALDWVLDSELVDTVALVDDASAWVFDYGLALADTAALVDALAADDTLAALADTVALVDLFDAGIGIDLQLTDTVALVDLFDSNFVIPVDLADTVTLVDAITGIDDGLGINDVVALVDATAWDDTLTLADVVGLLDVVIVDFPPQPIDQADVVPLADQLDLAQGYDLQASDAAALVDAVVFDDSVVTADVVALVDLLTPAWDLGLADVVGLVDALGIDDTLVLADTVPLVDDPLFGYQIDLGTLADVVALADTLTWVQITNWLIPLPEDGIAVSVSTDDTLVLTGQADDTLALTPSGGATPLATGLPEDVLVGSTLTEVEH